MANKITTNLIMNSSRQYVLLYNLLADGSGDLSASLILNTTLDLPVTAKLAKLWYLTGSVKTDAQFTAQLLWKATTNVPLVSLAPNHSDCMDFMKIGGIPNPKASGVTGDVVLTTTGMATAGDTVTMLLEFLKV